MVFVLLTFLPDLFPVFEFVLCVVTGPLFVVTLCHVLHRVVCVLLVPVSVACVFGELPHSVACVTGQFCDSVVTCCFEFV